MSERHKYQVSCPRIESVQPLNLLLVHQGDKEIGDAERQSSAEVRWRNADDGKRMLVHPNRAAHHPAVILKMGVPIRVTEHEIWCAVRAMLIGAVKETAKIRSNAQHVEVIPGDEIGPGEAWVFTGIQSYLIDSKACQAIEAAVA